jgi:hypothetical protein
MGLIESQDDERILALCFSGNLAGRGDRFPILQGSSESVEGVSGGEVVMFGGVKIYGIP